MNNAAPWTDKEKSILDVFQNRLFPLMRLRVRCHAKGSYAGTNQARHIRMTREEGIYAPLTPWRAFIFCTLLLRSARHVSLRAALPVLLIRLRPRVPHRNGAVEDRP